MSVKRTEWREQGEEGRKHELTCRINGSVGGFLDVFQELTFGDSRISQQ